MRTLWPGLSGDDPLTRIRLPQRVFLAISDRARPGLVALYDIRPGNGAGQFLQPRSPHGAPCSTSLDMYGKFEMPTLNVTV